MPPVTYPSGTLLCTMHLAGPDGTSAANVLHCTKVGGSGSPLSPADFQTVGNAFMNGYTTPGTSLGQVLATGWSLLDCTVVDLDTGQEGVSNVPAFPGPSGETPLPASIAVCLSWQGVGRWRGGHFRTYLAGISSVNMDSSGGRYLNAPSQSHFQAAAENWLTSVNNTPALSNGDTIVMGGIRRPKDPITKDPLPPFFFPYFGVAVDSRIDSQRRRLGKQVAN